jgi:hypothetical protein
VLRRRNTSRGVLAASSSDTGERSHHPGSARPVYRPEAEVNTQDVALIGLCQAWLLSELTAGSGTELDQKRSLLDVPRALRTTN